MIKKLKCWLIHKLGGYTEEEYDTAEEPWYAVAADYRDKYKTEHENYLALLNCHNATAEAAQQNTAGVAGVIDIIKAYCARKDDCVECAFYNGEDGCKFPGIPRYWEVE